MILPESWDALPDSVDAIKGWYRAEQIKDGSSEPMELPYRVVHQINNHLNQLRKPLHVIQLKRLLEYAERGQVRDR